MENNFVQYSQIDTTFFTQVLIVNEACIVHPHGHTHKHTHIHTLTHTQAHTQTIERAHEHNHKNERTYGKQKISIQHAPANPAHGKRPDQKTEKQAWLVTPAV